MPDAVLKNLPFLLAGLKLTAELAFWSIIGGTALGLASGYANTADAPAYDISSIQADIRD